MTFLHLESFENKLFDYISRYSKNRVFTVKPLKKVNIFLHGYDIFFMILAPFHIQKKILKVSDYFVEKIQHE